MRVTTCRSAKTAHPDGKQDCRSERSRVRGRRDGGADVDATAVLSGRRVPLRKAGEVLCGRAPQQVNTTMVGHGSLRPHLDGSCPHHGAACTAQTCAKNTRHETDGRVIGGAWIRVVVASCEGDDVARFKC